MTHEQVLSPPLEAAYRHLADLATEGLAILDASRRFIYVNEAGTTILRTSGEALLGRPALVFPVLPDGLPRGDTRVASLDGGRRVEYAEKWIGANVVVSFSDITEQLRRERHLAAFAQTASSVATSRDLAAVLNEVAARALEATDVPACTLVLFDPATSAIERVGTAGGYPADYVERLEGCRRRGAPLASLAAFESGGAFVRDNWCQQVLGDPRWLPMHSVLRERDWGSLAAIPLTSHGETIGALTAFYPRGQDPTTSDVEFLTSIAGLVAVAVQNHKLLAKLGRESALEERQRIARDLHDSVSQALFSLSLHTRALELINSHDLPGRTERVHDGLGELRELTTLMSTEMRALIFHLRPTALQDEGLLKAVEKHAAAVAARAGLLLSVTGSTGDVVLPRDAEEDLFRILQEALHNSSRHARASAIAIRFEPDTQGGLRVTVQDDGSGFDVSHARPGHFGLETMAERASALGGHLTITSDTGGTRVTVVLANLPGGER